MATVGTVSTSPAGVEITLVDAPDAGMDSPEGQRVYSLSRDGTRAAVRVRRDTDGNDGSYHRYVVENLVGGKWHRLLVGDVGVQRPALMRGDVEVYAASFDGRTIDFDAAILRAAAVLFAPKAAV